MPDPVGTVSLKPGEGATIQGPAGGPLTFKLRAEQSNGSLTVVENIIAPNDGPPLHVHEREDESWYVLEGELRFRLDDAIRDAPAGSFVFVPRGVAHCFQNVGDKPARILVMFTPSGMEAEHRLGGRHGRRRATACAVAPAWAAVTLWRSAGLCR
jgi:quercetin dioxygenase-like cupin family protein